jgi:hypothetical protein
VSENQRVIMGGLGAASVLAGFGLFPVPSHSSLKFLGMIGLWLLGLVLASAAMKRTPNL